MTQGTKILLLAIVIGACSPLVPATPPQQLDHTPGAFISLDDDRFNGGDFTVDVPDGWRVIKTSTAAAPLEVVFASPDDELTIRLSVAPLQEGAASAALARHERYEVWSPRAEFQVYLVGLAPAARATEFDPIFDRVEDSLEFVS